MEYLIGVTKERSFPHSIQKLREGESIADAKSFKKIEK